MHTFQTPAPISAVLDIPAGRVQVTATDRTDTTVQVGPANAAKARDVKAAQRTTVTYIDGVLHIHTADPGNQYFGPTGALTVTVELPAGSRVQATSAACELQAAGGLGEVVVQGAYRQTTIEDATSLHLTAIEGDVAVGRLGGPAQISTTRGDIRIAEAVSGTVVLRTQSGSITVGAAPGVSAALDAGTSSGRISNTLKNNGTTELDIHATTSYGDITAHSC